MTGGLSPSVIGKVCALYGGAPTAEVAVGREVRTLLMAALRTGLPPSPATASILALMDANRRALTRRAAMPWLTIDSAIAVTQWLHPYATRPQRHPSLCQDCGAALWRLPRPERTAHERRHVSEAVLRQWAPGLLTSGHAREYVIRRAPTDDADDFGWATYALNVLWALYSQDYIAHCISRNGKLRRIKEDFVSFPTYVFSSLVDFTIALLIGQWSEANLRLAAERVPWLFTLEGAFTVGFILANEEAEANNAPA